MPDLIALTRCIWITKSNHAWCWF